jgi:hypothetical protein
VAGPDGDPPGGRAAHGRVVIFFALILAYACFCRGHRPAASCPGGAIATQLEEASWVGGIGFHAGGR